MVHGFGENKRKGCVAQKGGGEFAHNQLGGRGQTSAGPATTKEHLFAQGGTATEFKDLQGMKGPRGRGSFPHRGTRAFLHPREPRLCKSTSYQTAREQSFSRVHGREVSKNQAHLAKRGDGSVDSSGYSLGSESIMTHLKEAASNIQQTEPITIEGTHTDDDNPPEIAKAKSRNQEKKHKSVKQQ